MDIHARVAAFQAGERERKELLALLQGSAGQLSVNHHIRAARTADIHLATVFAIQVEQQRAFQPIFSKVQRTAHGGLFLQGEQRFQRAMGQLGVFQYGQNGRHAHAIIRP